MKMVDPNEEVKEVIPVQVTDPEFWPIEDLPSKYLLYPKGIKIFGRPLKLIEVKKLSLLNEENFDITINTVLASAIRGIQIEDLLIADKLYIIFWLRANTYREPGYEVSFFCDKCEKMSNYMFTLDNLSVVYLKEDFLQNNIFNNLTLGFLTVAEELEVKKFKKSSTEIDDEIVNVAATVKLIDGKKETIQKKYSYLIEMKPTEYVKLKSIITKYEIGVNGNLKVKCQKCGGEAQVGVTFRPNFFLPDYTVG